jgi:ribosome-binding protein aMBF1 (putative translation factor)
MTGTPATRREAQRWTTVLDGGRLQHRRRRRGLSQEQLASQAGISLTTMNTSSRLRAELAAYLT